MSEIRPQGAVGRVLGNPLGLLGLGFILFNLLYVLTGIASGVARPLRNTPLQALIVLAMAALGVAVYKWFQRVAERRQDDEYALAGAGRELGLGLLFGFLLFSGMTGIVALLGGFGIDGVRGGVGDLWRVTAMAIASGIYEEMVFRGIAFRQIEKMGGSWLALLLTSAFFGLSHIANPNATWFAAFAIAVEAGVLLGAAYMLTRRLWLATGIHAAWNFTQGWIFSVPVSGGKAPEGLLVAHRSGAEWLTGGDFGLEASAVAMVVATTAGLVMLWLAFRQGRFVPFPGKSAHTKL